MWSWSQKGEIRMFLFIWSNPYPLESFESLVGFNILTIVKLRKVQLYFYLNKHRGNDYVKDLRVIPIKKLSMHKGSWIQRHRYDLLIPKFPPHAHWYDLSLPLLSSFSHKKIRLVWSMFLKVGSQCKKIRLGRKAWWPSSDWSKWNA
jgi:hypothetical protein